MTLCTVRLIRGPASRSLSDGIRAIRRGLPAIRLYRSPSPAATAGLAHAAEHAVDLETGAIVGVTVQDAAAGDTTTMVATLSRRQ